MIVLYGFGATFDLPEASPFVIKTKVQLDMAQLPHRVERGSLQQSPKAKLPYILDGDRKIGDSTFIRAHIEATYGADLDHNLNAEQRAQSWAIERMLEDHLYWAILYFRWIDDANFAKGPAHFFDEVSADRRDAARQAGRERVRQKIYDHGLGHHREDEIAELAGRSVAALAAFLSEKPYLMGSEPCGADATAFGMITSVLTPFFDTRLRSDALRHANLVDYDKRMMRRYYPDFIRSSA
jgi:glutathione S-transferase